MSNPNSFNPYAAPAPGYTPDAKSMSRGGRPGWYTFYCVIAIVLGSLGAANAVTGSVGLFFADSFQGGFAGGPQQGVSQEFLDKQEEMNNEMQAITHRYFVFLLASQVLLAVVGIGLLVGGILAIQMRKFGARLLGTMFMVTSVFDVARLVMTILYNMEAGQVMQKHFGPLMEMAQPPGAATPPGFADCITNSISAAFGGFICMIVVWTIVKLWIYLSGWFYLNKPEIQALLKD